MGFIFGVIKRLLKLILYVAVFVSIIALIPNLPPYTPFSKIALESTQPRIGPLAPNTVLNNAIKLYKGKLLGPEAFQLYNGEVYTGLATGEIVKISPGGHVTFVTKIGQPCTGLTQEHICGRPLGFVIDEKNKNMYVADAYHGIWKVDLKSDKKQLLVSPRVEINGQKPLLFNSVTLDKNGDLYWTDSTSDFQLKDGVYAMITDPAGRLFYYNAAKNESKVLLDKLWFANGVAVSPDNQFVVVSETSRFKLTKYYIDGPKKGKSEVFVAGLPGVPDNIRALPDGSGVLVGLYNVFDDKDPLISKSLSEIPILRKFLARVLRLIEIPFEFLNNQYPHIVFEEVVYSIGHFKTVSFLAPHVSGLVQIDWDGKIIASYYSDDGSVAHISDAIVYNDKLYLGCPHQQNYIAAVPAPPLLKKAFESVLSSPPPKTAETVTKEIPKAKTETKPVESSKQKVQDKPKVEEKKETPRVTKPAAQEPPKPTQQPKNVENEKPTTTKPVEEKPAEHVTPPPTKPTAPPKQAESKPIAPKQAAPESKPQSKPATPPKQPEIKPGTLPKPEVNLSSEQKPASKPAQAQPSDKAKKTETETKPQKTVKKDSSKPANDKTVPEQIPIKEEIPSDTVKPSKETLKVIRKGGPTEIPNPNL